MAVCILTLEVAPTDGAREGEQQAWDEHKKPAWRRAVSRMPALLVTLVIELFVAFIVSEYSDRTQTHPGFCVLFKGN